MKVVRAAMKLAGSVHEAEHLWYDTSRWSTWVDGFGHVTRIDGPWPETGAKVVWDSYPAGRGRVTERVVAHEPLSGQVLDVEDESIRGRQTIVFMPLEDAVEVELSLEYELKRRSIVTPVLDVLFIRRPMAASLRSTLARFGVELAADRERGGPSAD